jgi:hypothetical protein
MMVKFMLTSLYCRGGKRRQNASRTLHVGDNIWRKAYYLQRKGGSSTRELCICTHLISGKHCVLETSFPTFLQARAVLIKRAFS